MPRLCLHTSELAFENSRNRKTQPIEDGSTQFRAEYSRLESSAYLRDLLMVRSLSDVT